MIKKVNLTEAAKDILTANVLQKRAQDKQLGVGNSQLKPDVAYGTKDMGEVGESPEKETDELPDYTKGIGKATPPGATPPVGSEKDGVGYSLPKNQPQVTQGRTDLSVPTQVDATPYADIANRIAGLRPTQTMQANPGATFQQYEELELDLSDDVNALLEGESLSDEFKEKATTIFEAAIKTRLESIIAQLQETYETALQTALEETTTELETKLDEALNYMVNEWFEDNKIAIEAGLRSEIVEEFLEKLHDLFIESYIDIPEEKVDVVEELASQVAELQDQFNEQIEKNIQLTKMINEQKKINAIHAVCEGLTQTQVEKMKSLAESIDFTTSTEFETKLEILKESYFPTQVKTGSGIQLNEETDFNQEETKTYDSEMDIYAKTISKTVKK